MTNLFLTKIIVSEFFVVFFCKNCFADRKFIRLISNSIPSLDYLDLLPSGGWQLCSEIPTALQSNIEKAADALIGDETDKIAKTIVRLFLFN